VGSRAKTRLVQQQIAKKAQKGSARRVVLVITMSPGNQADGDARGDGRGRGVVVGRIG